MKHLLKMTDLTKQEVLKILNVADQMKFNLTHGLEHETLKGRNLAMIFNKSSTRTRVSFEVGIAQLGGHGLFLNSNDIQLGRGETIEDTAKVLSRYVDGIMIRTFKQSDVEELAKYAGVPVINALTDDEHPCQVLADLMTIREYRSSLQGLTVAWVGDGNNVCNSLIAGALLCDMKIKAATPKGYEPARYIRDYAGQRLSLTNDPREAVAGADVVFTDVWASMGQETEAAARLKAFEGFQLNAELMKLAKPDVMVQHCLPAHRGEEITADVFDAHAEQIYDEAENRLHVQKAIMTLLMGEEPV
ncbi:MAG: ornithine carbamoyltransferase [Oscillospiraceae bacterium]|nr:ornithine carbamoyltransferase [Oscillospiraceae bacterium]